MGSTAVPAALLLPMQLHLATALRVELPDGRSRPLAPLDAALLAWLALEGPTPRARLAGLLWADKDDDAARNSLRQRLFQLHRKVGADLVVGAATLALADGVTHDLHEADELLDGVALEADGEFGVWIEQQRARRRARVRASLVELSEMAEGARDWEDALAHARELVALDPLSEDAHRRVMRLHYLAGDRAAALLAFDACEQMLKHEVGAQPSPETLALLAALQRADSALLPRPALRPATLQRPPRLIGRSAAWDALVEAGASGELALVEGEAGMGKSRLVGDYALRSPQASLTVGARPGDASVPYACAARLVRSLVQRCGEPPAPIRRTLARLLPEWGEVHPIDDERETTRIHAAIGAMLERAAARGVSLVVFDDLHFADAASVEAVCALAAGTAPAWVFTTRPGEGWAAVRDAADRLLASSRVRRIALAPLGESEIAELVDSLGVPGWSGAEMAPRLARHTGGNPLFLLETLKSMPLDGVSPAGRMPAARSVTELVARRIGRLSREAVRIARCAALAGEDFSVELASHLLGTGPLDLADAWAELEAAHVLHEQAFAHDLIREAARASVPAPLARQLHGQIAQYLAGRDAPPQRVAAHWRMSVQPQHAVPYLLRAGQEAMRALRRDEAAQWLVEAADLLERGGDRQGAFEALDRLFGLRRFPADALQKQMIDRLIALAETPLQRALAAERHAGWLSQRGEFARATEVAEAALGAFRHEQAPALASALMVQQTSGQLQRGENDEAVRTMYRAVALAEASDDDDAKQNAVGTLATALNWAGRCGESEPHKVRALELARQLGQPHMTIDAMIELAATRRAIGRIEAAHADLEQAAQMARSHDIEIERHWPWFGLERARLEMWLGDYAQAVPHLEQGARVLGAEMPSWRIAADNLATTLWMTLGQWARARLAAEAALACCEAALPLYAAQARALALQVDLALGPVPDALQRVGDALARLGGGSTRAAQGLQLLRSTLVDPEEALSIAGRVRDEARACGLLGAVLDAELLASRAAQRAGDVPRSASHARAALELWASGIEPSHAYRAEVWLEAVRAFQAAEPDRVPALLRQATRWLEDTAADRVAGEFRDSFLHRNPVNRDLLALAGRLTPS